MSIPPGQIDLHHPHARFDQSTRRQKTLPPQITPIEITSPV